MDDESHSLLTTSFKIERPVNGGYLQESIRPVLSNQINSPMVSKNSQQIPTALSLFSGCGGFCEGVELAGFKVKCAVELDRFAVETYEYNFPEIPVYEGDVAQFLKAPDGEHLSKFGLDTVDMVFGGPPCQGYSQIGPRSLGDERNQLYKEFVRVVDKLRPKIFLMENVPNLVLMRKGHYRDLMLRAFRQIGYSNTFVMKVSAADFGVPQLRERVIFIGIPDEIQLSSDLENLCRSALDGMKEQQRFTVDDAISDLPDEVVPSGELMPYPRVKALNRYMRMMRLEYSEPPYTIGKRRERGIGQGRRQLHNHHTKEIQERRARLISYLDQGKKADSLPKDIWNGKRPEKWRRLHPDEPSYTILAQMHRDLSEWVHPNLDRWITVREAARLQSFHDGFIFRSSEWQMLKQIGNAVPPLLAHALAQMSIKVLDKIDTRNTESEGCRLPRSESRLRVEAAE